MTNIPIMFEDYEKALTIGIVTSSIVFTRNDLRQLAEIGAISLESVDRLTDNDIAPDTNLAKKALLHRKALAIVAHEQGDPRYNALTSLVAEEHKIYAELDQEYTKSANKYQGDLVRKIVTKCKESGTTIALECAQKIAQFQ
jgi:hypothetical protein